LDVKIDRLRLSVDIEMVVGLRVSSVVALKLLFERRVSFVLCLQDIAPQPRLPNKISDFQNLSENNITHLNLLSKFNEI
jgi:hypothetical protein